MARALFLAAVFAVSPAFAEPPGLGLPLDCTLGESCFIQNYVDADPGPGYSDFGCGGLSYDGHQGTDFALPSVAAMTAGVKVLAAATGVVRGVRDGMPDLGLDETPAHLLVGQECGNGVLIDHGDGWETQYCHMKRDSIAVAPGDTVALGAPLGEVGFSGRTQFPHLHISLRHNGAVVDPFNVDGYMLCRDNVVGVEDGLWDPPLSYVAGGLISVGMAPGIPAYDDIKSGAALRDTLSAASPALVGWAQVFGGRPGDAVEITLTDPSGAAFYRHEATLDKAQVRLFRAAGKKTPPGGWANGEWTVTARLLRDGMPLDEMRATVRVRD